MDNILNIYLFDFYYSMEFSLNTHFDFILNIIYKQKQILFVENILKVN